MSRIIGSVFDIRCCVFCSDAYANFLKHVTCSAFTLTIPWTKSQKDEVALHPCKDTLFFFKKMVDQFILSISALVPVHECCLFGCIYLL